MWRVYNLKGFNLEKANEKQVFVSFRIWTGYWALPLSLNFDEERRNHYSVIITILCFSLKLTLYKPE